MNIARCPHCEALHTFGIMVSVERGLIEWPGGELHAPPSEVRIFASILRRGAATPANLIHDLYSHKTDGGPEQPAVTIRVLICRLRRRLLAAGFPGAIHMVSRGSYVLSVTKEEQAA